MMTACDASFAMKRADDLHRLEAAASHQAAANAFVAGAELGYDCGVARILDAALWGGYRPGDILSFYALVSVEAARRAPTFLNCMQLPKSEKESLTGDPVWVAASSLHPLQCRERLKSMAGDCVLNSSQSHEEQRHNTGA